VTTTDYCTFSARRQGSKTEPADRQQRSTPPMLAHLYSRPAIHADRIDPRVEPL